MSRLVKELTDLAQMDAGRPTMQRTREDPADHVREVLEPVMTGRPCLVRAARSSFRAGREDAPSPPRGVAVPAGVRSSGIP